jgi:TonB family protein
MAVGVIAVFAAPALAKTEITRDVDQVNGVTTYSAVVFAQSFKPISNEPWLGLTCSPSGKADLKWHEGGALTGSYGGGPIGVSYRFDKLPPVKTTFEAIQTGQDLRDFYRDLTTHKQLLIISEFSIRSETLNIADFGAKAGPKTAIGRQCYASLIAAPLVTPVVVQAPVVATAPAAVMRTHTLPPYPTISQRLGEKGVTKLKLSIDGTGSVATATILKTSGSERLDEAAIEHVKHFWKYAPQKGMATATIDWTSMSAN